MIRIVAYITVAWVVIVFLLAFDWDEAGTVIADLKRKKKPAKRFRKIWIYTT